MRTVRKGYLKMIFETFYDAMQYAQALHTTHHLSYTIYRKSLAGLNDYFIISRTCQSIKDDFWCYHGIALCSTITCI